MRQLLELIIDPTASVVMDEFSHGERDVQGLLHGEVCHAVRKLKQPTDEDYNNLRREAERFSEGAHSENMG